MPNRPDKAEPYGASKPTPRPKTTARGYDARHVAMRERILNARPLCELAYPGCKGFAHHIHHLTYPAYSDADYVSCCSYCHGKIHRQ